MFQSNQATHKSHTALSHTTHTDNSMPIEQLIMRLLKELSVL